jgi:hypothetical protein
LFSFATTLVLMKARGLNVDDPKIVRIMTRRIVASLGHWKRRGYLQSSPGPGIKGALLWSIADNPQRFASYDAGLSGVAGYSSTTIRATMRLDMEAPRPCAWWGLSFTRAV